MTLQEEAINNAIGILVHAGLEETEHYNLLVKVATSIVKETIITTKNHIVNLK